MGGLIIAYCNFHHRSHRRITKNYIDTLTLYVVPGVCDKICICLVLFVCVYVWGCVGGVGVGVGVCVCVLTHSILDIL